MKKLLLALALLVGSLAIGCNLPTTAHERAVRYENIVGLQGRMVNDDWDAIWLMERNTRLSRWHPRVGWE
jgi:hypothetical protein